MAIVKMKLASQMARAAAKKPAKSVVILAAGPLAKESSAKPGRSKPSAKTKAGPARKVAAAKKVKPVRKAAAKAKRPSVLTELLARWAVCPGPG